MTKISACPGTERSSPAPTRPARWRRHPATPPPESAGRPPSRALDAASTAPSLPRRAHRRSRPVGRSESRPPCARAAGAPSRRGIREGCRILRPARDGPPSGQSGADDVGKSSAKAPPVPVRRGLPPSRCRSVRRRRHEGQQIRAVGLARPAARHVRKPRARRRAPRWRLRSSSDRGRTPRIRRAQVARADAGRDHHEVVVEAHLAALRHADPEPGGRPYRSLHLRHGNGDVVVALAAEDLPDMEAAMSPGARPAVATW